MRHGSLLILCMIFYTCLSAQADIAAVKLFPSQMPPGIKVKGRITDAWQWSDSLGTNLLILSGSGLVQGQNGDEQSQQIFASHYVSTGTGYRQLWNLTDGVTACPLDLEANFLPGSTRITDLDKDGIAETTLVYRLACRGDVSPSDMKLIMHEDTVKFALRGVMWMDIPSGDPADPTVNGPAETNVNLETLPGYTGKDEEYAATFGRYRNEKDFAKAPGTFITFARRHWLRHAKESFD
jgi:hypothetical protein